MKGWQRWTLGHIAQKLALFAAIVLVAWLSGQLDQVTDKRHFAAVVIVAAAIVFLAELVYQSRDAQRRNQGRLNCCEPPSYSSLPALPSR